MKPTIIHGGQRGVDRGAWRAAKELHLLCGGWMPRDMRDENGPIPAEVAADLQQAEGGLRFRTERNVRDSDARLIVSSGGIVSSPGTRWTLELCRRLAGPWLVVGGIAGYDDVRIREFCNSLREAAETAPRLYGDPRLMVAGPRASLWPDGEEVARVVVHRVAAYLRD